MTQAELYSEFATNSYCQIEVAVGSLSPSLPKLTSVYSKTSQPRESKFKFSPP